MIIREIPKHDKSKGMMFYIKFSDEPDPTGKCPRVKRISPVQTKVGAAKFERELRAQIREGLFRKKREEAKTDQERREAMPTFSDFSEEFLTNRVRREYKPSSQVATCVNLKRHLVPAFGFQRLDEIRPRGIEAFKAHLVDELGLCNKTANNILTVLRSCLRYAIEVEIIKELPVFKPFPREESKFDFFDFAEAEQLLEAANYRPRGYDKNEWYFMIFVALRTGLRFGELIELRRTDLDLVAGKLMVNRSCYRGYVTSPKSGKSREIPLTPDTVALFKQHRHIRSDLIFCTPQGKQHKYEKAYHALKRICCRAGLREIGWHTLRHTYASHLVMRGVLIKIVQELLGHADIKTTMRYVHLSPKVKYEAVAVLDSPAPIAVQN